MIAHISIIHAVVGIIIPLAVLLWTLLAPPIDGAPRHLRIVDLPRLKVQVMFDWRDFWIGFLGRRTGSGLQLCICLIPCFPIHVTIARFPK